MEKSLYLKSLRFNKIKEFAKAYVFKPLYTALLTFCVVNLVYLLFFLVKNDFSFPGDFSFRYKHCNFFVNDNPIGLSILKKKAFSLSFYFMSMKPQEFS